MTPHSIALLVLLLAALVASPLLLIWLEDRGRYGLAALTALGALCVFFVVILLLVSRLSVPGDLAELAETRAAVVQLGCSASEDVMGSALAINRNIASGRTMRRAYYFARLAIPPVYDTLSTIDIPACR